MNINVNELSLLNKKLKLREEPEKSTISAIVKPEQTSQDQGMKALMFQGMNNIVSDPVLAEKMNGTKDVPSQEAEQTDAKDYVVPYQSNIAFQGKASRFKNFALAALMGLASLGSVATMTSCETDKEIIEVPTPGPDINIEINIDLSTITAMMEQMQLLWLQMLEQQKITNEQMQENNKFMHELIEMYKQDRVDNKQFQEKFFNFMISSTANQEVMIELLVQNGMKQDEANKFLLELVQEVKSGKTSAAEAFNRLMDMLGDIKGILQQQLDEFQKFAKEVLQNQEDMIAVGKQGFEELIARGDITNKTLDEIKEKQDKLQESSDKQVENQNKILASIEKANLDSNANFDKVVETLNVNKKDLIGTLVQMGLKQEEIQKMTAAEIKAAIKENTQMQANGNYMLCRIMGQLTILPELAQQGKVTNDQIKEFYKLYQEVSVQDGNYQKETLDKMEHLLSELEKVNSSLDEIKDMLNKFMEEFRNVSQKVMQNQQDQMSISKQGFDELSMYGKITAQTSVKIAEQIDKLQQSSDNQTQILYNIKNTLEKSNIDNNAKFDEVIETLGINKKDIIGVMVQLGISQQEAMNMNKSEIIGAIDKNSQEVAYGNSMLINISKQINELEKHLENGSISQENINEFKQIFNQIQINQGYYSKEMLQKMEVLLDKLNNIDQSLNEIKDMLNKFMEEFRNVSQKVMQNQQDQMSISKQGFDELSMYGKITAQTSVKIAEQIDKLQQSSDNQTQILYNIKNTLEKSNIDNNAKFDEVIETLGINKKDIIGVMVQLGISQQEAMNMNKSEIIGAIDKNSQEVAYGNSMLINISKQINELEKHLGNGSISQENIDEFKQIFNQIQINQGHYSKEMLQKMEVLLDKLNNIDKNVEEILGYVKNLSESFNEFRSEYSNNQKVEFKLLEELVKDNKFQNNVLVQMSSIQKEMNNNLEGLNKNVNNLIEISKDDSRHKELINAIKNIQAGGSGTIDYERLEEMFNSFGITISQSIKMSNVELQRVLEDFKKTYIQTENKQSQQLSDIMAKLDEIKVFDGLNKNEIVNAINNVNKSVNAGNEDITNELQSLNQEVKVLQDQVKAVLKAIEEQSKIVNSYLDKFNTKFDAIFNNLEDLKNNTEGQLAALIAKAKTAEIYRENMQREVVEIKNAIKNLEGISGGNIDLSKIEGLLQQNNQSLIQILNKMGIESEKLQNLEDILISIDNKMDYTKVNTDLILKVLLEIQSNSDYNAKLDKIIELLKNFKCNCDCGNNNEGVLGDLDNILG